MLDKHSGRIACQTCHIPHCAAKYKTKMWWDWSNAGLKACWITGYEEKEVDEE